MSLYKPPTITEEVYRFSDLVLVARRWKGARRPTWLVCCQTCEDRLLVQRVSTKQWVARCHKCKVEYVITPAEYYIMKYVDFSRIMGAL